MSAKRWWKLNKKEIKRLYPIKSTIQTKVHELCHGEEVVMESLVTMDDHIQYIFKHPSNFKSISNEPVSIRIYLNKDFNKIKDFNKQHDIWADITLGRDNDSDTYELEDLIVDVKSEFSAHIKNKLRDKSLYLLYNFGITTIF
eukprot:232657_1